MAGAGWLALAGSIQAQVPEKPDLKFSLDWLFQGPQAPMVLAAEGGHFRAEGMNVTVDRGSGSANTIHRVASGAYDVGFADLNSIIKFNADNPGREITAFYMVFDASPLAIMSLAEKNIMAPKDLNGRRLGGPVADGARQMFPVFARLHRLDSASITWISVDPSLRETLLVRGEVDAISGFITSGPLSIEARGVPPERIRTMKFADHGLDFFGSALFARAEFIAQYPRTIRAFARAMNRALKDSIARPELAIEVLKKRDPLLDPQLELRRLRIAIDQLVATPAVRAGGLSVVDPRRLERNVAMVAEGFGMPSQPTAALVFTDRFLPPAAERMLPR
jgi:NitT/TauT family transport system substrate-binding protein